MNNPRWKGIFPAVTTKFHADESLDLEGTAKHLDFQIRNGIHGLVTCGSLGEASTLTLEEKLLVAKNALEVSADTTAVSYGIAWEVQLGTGPQLTLTRTGAQNVLALSQIDPLKTYTIETSTDLSTWQSAATIRTADTAPATHATWQESSSLGAKFYRLNWAP